MKDVINGIRIGPVVVGTDRMLKRAIDSVLQQYPGVQAVVADSQVVLEGRVETDRLQQLLAAVRSLQPRLLENRLSVK